MKHNTLEAFGESITTTDATVTPIVTFSTKPSKAYLVTAKVVAQNQLLTQAAGYMVLGTFRTDAAGVLTQVGSTTVLTPMEDNAAWNVLFAVSQTDAAGAANPEIRLTATGAAATNINWRADVSINRVGVGPENT